MVKMKEGSVKYNDEAIQLALSQVRIMPCIDCGHPVNDGHCCGHCGSGNGSGNDEESHIEYRAVKSC